MNFQDTEHTADRQLEQQTGNLQMEENWEKGEPDGGSRLEDLSEWLRIV